MIHTHFRFIQVLDIKNEKNISSERALYELHKNMSYDDKYPDTKENEDIWQVDASEIQLDVLPGEIP